MTKNWEPLRDEIQQLYHVENRKLTEVMRIIQGRHGFKASERSYRTQMRDWGYMKYSTQDFPKPNRNTRPSKQRRKSSSAAKSDRVTSGISPTAQSFNPRAPPVGPAPAFLSQSDGAGTSYMDGTHSLSTGNYTSPSMNHAEKAHAAWPANAVSHHDANDRRTDLHLAVLGQDDQQVKRLLFDGFSVDDEDNVSNRPLHYAVEGASENIVILLIKYGADVNVKGQLGRSPLHLAASKPSFIRHLLTAGAQTDLQDDNGDTPAHLAVLDFVQNTLSYRVDVSPSALYAMVDAKCDLNLTNLAGMTPFHGLLAQGGQRAPNNISNVQIHCLHNGASPTRPYPDGRTPLQMVLSCYQEPSLAVFTPLGRQTHQETDSVIKVLIEKGADPRTKFPTGTTLVSQYFETMSDRRRKPHYGLGEALCKHVDLMPFSDSDGRLRGSLLHILAQRCFSYTGYGTFDIIPLIKAVLQRGADPNMPDEEGKTPLLLLFQSKGNAQETVARATELMMKHGGNPLIADFSGKSPVFAASELRGSRLCVNHVYQLLKPTLDFNDSGSAPVERQPSPRECLWNDWESALNAKDWNQAIKIIRGCQPPCSSAAIVNLKKGACKALAEWHLKAPNKTPQSPEEILQRRRHIAQILHDCQLLDVNMDMRYYHELVQLSL